MGALGSSYASVPELEYRLGRADDGSFGALLDAASRRVETFTRRQFNMTDTATARRFRPVDPHRLPVDDFHTTEDLAVSVDGVAWDVDDDIDPRPWNGVVNGQSGWPFFDLFAVNRRWSFSRRATVTVTAQWGWAAVPEGIVQATLDVAAVMSYGSGGSFPKTQETIQDYSVSYAVPSGATAVDVPAELTKAVPYRRKLFGVA